MFLEKGWLIFSGGGVRAKKFSRASFLRWWGQGQKVQNWCFLRWLGQGPKSVFSLDLLFLWRPRSLLEYLWRIVSGISRASWISFQIFGVQPFLIKKCFMILCVLGILLGTPCGLSKVCNLFWVSSWCFRASVALDLRSLGVSLGAPWLLQATKKWNFAWYCVLNCTHVCDPLLSSLRLCSWQTGSAWSCLSKCGQMFC